jgi:UDP-N-acetylmuramoyl-L-alanyl-D-glutamate--2,6-diaminopimelate ligase
MKKLVKKIVPVGAFKKVEPFGHLGESVYYQSKTGFPGRKIKVIGVTGTDGKTSTSTLITNMLRNSGKKVAMMTTISVDYGDGNGPQDNPSRLTTFGAAKLSKAVKKMADEGVEWLVLEVTSHALSQYRVWGVPIYMAVFTNLGHEHLDYHGTFENYRDAKRRLFKLANKNKNGSRVGIVNADDGVAEFFASDIKYPLTYGQKKGDLRAVDVKLSPSGSEYTAKIDGDEYKIVCHLPGSFNVYNSLAAVAVGRTAGLSKEQIEQGIASLEAVEGRMTRVDEGQDFAIIVDYAHTPESFDKLFAELRPLTKKRLICVFGSAGRRDEAKRAEQGRIAGKWCDIVIATEEDDRDIDGELILRQIVSGAEASGKVLNKDVLMVHNREEAVQMAINVAREGDLVVLLGKGHEKSILYNGPKAAELRNLPQDDGDPRRVLKRDYDEVKAAKVALKLLNK